MVRSRTLILAALMCFGVKSMAFSFILQGPAGELKELQGQNGVVKYFSRGHLPTGGQVIAARDFDGNGSTDLILRYDPDGAGPRPEGIYLWRFRGESRIGVTQIGGVPSSYTVPAGVCDLDKDGNSEFLMYNPTNHAVKAFEVLKMAPFAGGERTVTAGGQGDHYTRVIAAGDVDQDGHEDLILEDLETRTLKVRYLNGTSTTSFGNALLVNAPKGKAVGVAYFGAPTILDPFVVYESPDGIAPRQYLRFDTPGLIDQGEITFDDPYRSWPIVAIVP
jgi:hypothetical protein